MYSDIYDSYKTLKTFINSSPVKIVVAIVSEKGKANINSFTLKNEVIIQISLRKIDPNGPSVKKAKLSFADIHHNIAKENSHLIFVLR